MRLEANCKNCGSHISFHTFEETRADYAKNKGKLITVKCKKCKIEAQHHINEFTAKSYTLRILGWSILIMSYFLVSLSLIIPNNLEYVHNFFWVSKGEGVAILIVPGVIFKLIISAAHRQERAYNTYRVKQ